jgi:hypothetical protein
VTYQSQSVTVALNGYSCRCDDGSGKIADLIVRSAIQMLGSDGDWDFACNAFQSSRA